VERSPHRPDVADIRDIPDVPDLPGSARLVDGGGASLTGRLERWAADARVDEAARARSRERWLRRQAEEESSLVGVLVDLLEAGSAVTVHSRAGNRYGGVVRAVGADFVALGREAPEGADVLVALSALGSVRTRPGAPGVLGDRTVAGELYLADVLAGLAEERAAVQVVTTSGDVLGGTVAAVGHDVVTVRTAGRPPVVAYVPLGAVSELVVGE
jgi:hypothetical protein